MSDAPRRDEGPRPDPAQGAAPPNPTPAPKDEVATDISEVARQRLEGTDKTMTGGPTAAGESIAEDAADAAGKAIETRLKLEAKTIRDKYIAAPHTTDFGILFVPTEGLYAEALRRPGLVDALQREHKVMLAGPTTLLATLNSLQMGFRTLALEKRSAEVWQVLGAVKTEFGKFGDVLARTREKIDEVLASKKTVEAKFVKPVPVYVVYFSSAALNDGTIVDYKDLYNRDAKVLQALLDSKPASPIEKKSQTAARR